MSNINENAPISAYSAEQEALIQSALYCLERRIRYGDPISNPEDTRRYLRMQLEPELNEVFAVLFLDSAHRVLAFEKLFFGTIDSAIVHPRRVVQRALAHNASSVIFAHNHPSGMAEPSSADKYITEKLKTALALFDIRALDHVIVGAGCITSFVERGLL